MQKIRFRLVAIQRRVDDPAAPTDPDRRIDPDVTGHVAIRPQAVLATDQNRLEVERVAREAAFERQRAGFGVFGAESSGMYAKRAATVGREPLPIDARKAALESVDKELMEAGILGRDGEPSKEIVAELSWERDELLPTPGILVKGCLDQCDTCEPSLLKEIQLELKAKSLRNQMLERQIELLDKAQEYRCCPEGEAEDEDESG